MKINYSDKNIDIFIKKNSLNKQKNLLAKWIVAGWNQIDKADTFLTLSNQRKSKKTDKNVCVQNIRGYVKRSGDKLKFTSPTTQNL